jgi:hypothetical protein
VTNTLPTNLAGRDVARRWSPTLVLDGFTPISNYFLANYSRLSPPLKSGEALLVIHLMQFKWDETPPRPAFKTLANRMGISAAALRAHARSLEKKKYLLRKARIGQPNLFDLRPLFAALEHLRAQDERQERQAARQTISAYSMDTFRRDGTEAEGK